MRSRLLGAVVVIAAMLCACAELASADDGNHYATWTLDPGVNTVTRIDDGMVRCYVIKGYQGDGISCVRVLP
jgi:hypothetical protein